MTSFLPKSTLILRNFPKISNIGQLDKIYKKAEEMPQGKSIDPADFNNWLIERLRFTIFPQNTLNVEHANYWKDLIQEEPEQRINLPREGKIIEQGSWENGNLVFEGSLNRIDWRWDAIVNDNDILPNLGPFIKESPKFISLMEKWLKQSNDSTRIAFGGIFHLLVKDKIAGYEKIAGYLPYIELDPSSSDFQYSINRPRPSSLETKGIQINRLSKWSVGSVKQFQIYLDKGQSETFFKLSALRLELDINTVPNQNLLLPSENLSQIFRELFTLGQEIIEKGDIK